MLVLLGSREATGKLGGYWEATGRILGNRHFRGAEILLYKTSKLRTPQVQALCGELTENHLDIQFRVVSRGSRGPSRGSPSPWGSFPEGPRKSEEVREHSIKLRTLEAVLET